MFNLILKILRNCSPKHIGRIDGHEIFEGDKIVINGKESSDAETKAFVNKTSKLVKD